MTRAGRVRAVLTGDPPDRTPYALWAPLPTGVTDGDGFVRAVLEWDEAYAPDLLKLPPAAEWPLSGASGVRRLADLRRIRELLGGDPPSVLETLPADDAAGAEWVVAAVAEGGCAGAFLVRPEAGWSEDHATLATRLREAGAWCLVAHAHVPEDAPDWADAVSGPPDVLAALTRGSGGPCPVGGVDERRIAGRDAAAVRTGAREARGRFGGRLILAPGCSVPPWTPGANLRAVREAALGD